jgi:hypothetical protein
MNIVPLPKQQRLAPGRRRANLPYFYVAFAADGRPCGCRPVRRDERRALSRFATSLLADGGRLDCLQLNGRGQLDRRRP